MRWRRVGGKGILQKDLPVGDGKSGTRSDRRSGEMCSPIEIGRRANDAEEQELEDGNPV